MEKPNQCEICNRKLKKNESYDEHKKDYNKKGKFFMEGIKFEFLFDMDMKDAHCVVSHGYNLVKDSSTLKDLDNEGNIIEGENITDKEKEKDTKEVKKEDKIICDCGYHISKKGLPKHKKTKKHLNNLTK